MIVRKYFALCRMMITLVLGTGAMVTAGSEAAFRREIERRWAVLHTICRWDSKIARTINKECGFPKEVTSLVASYGVHSPEEVTSAIRQYMSLFVIDLQNWDKEKAVNVERFKKGCFSFAQIIPFDLSNSDCSGVNRSNIAVALKNPGGWNGFINQDCLLLHTNFTNAQMPKHYWPSIRYAYKARFVGSDLSDSKFGDETHVTDLSNADFAQAKMTRVRFVNTMLSWKRIKDARDIETLVLDDQSKTFLSQSKERYERKKKALASTR